jgi:uncharacterized protein
MTVLARVGARIHELDAIRGFALGGILVANIGFFADPGLSAGSGEPPMSGSVVATLLNTLVLTKFYVIFSFMFGYSFTLQMRSWGDKVKARMLRRCLGLFTLGVLQGFLMWIGDILTLYALLGLILLAVRGIRPRTAVKAGCWIIGVSAVVWLVLGVLLMATGSAAPAEDAANGQQALAQMTGTPLTFLQYQLATYPTMAPLVWLGQGPMAMALFLFGLAAGKSRLFEERERWAHLLPRIQWLGFGVGLPAAALYSWSATGDEGWKLVGMAMNNLTSLPLAAAYVVTLLRVIDRVPKVGAALAPAGRAAASNYIGQSVLACLIFTAYGLGLAGELPPVAVVGVAALEYAVLLALSAWWMRGHRQGPIEWGLRAITLCSAAPRRPR